MILLNGLLIDTFRSWIKFTYGTGTEIRDDLKNDCLYITFRRGFRSSDIIDKRFKLIDDKILNETKYISTKNPIYDLNGLKLTKIIPTDYVISQYLIDDIDCFEMRFDKTQCQIFIPRHLDHKLDKYLELLGKNPYIRVTDHTDLHDLKNFYSINLSDREVKIDSNNEFVFYTKKFYERYLLEPIDIQQSFIQQLGTQLKEFGLQLVSLPIDENVSTTDYITYRFTELNKQTTPRSGYSPFNYYVKQTSHIDFELTTPNLVILNDFKTRYQNSQLIYQFTRFQTLDKLGRNWSSNVSWSEISTDFSQEYDQDSQGNSAFHCNFSADLNYYVIYDEKYYEIRKILLTSYVNDTLDRVIIE